MLLKLRIHILVQRTSLTVLVALTSLVLRPSHFLFQVTIMNGYTICFQSPFEIHCNYIGACANVTAVSSVGAIIHQYGYNEGLLSPSLIVILILIK